MNDFLRPILGRVRRFLAISIIAGLLFSLGMRVFWWTGMNEMVKLSFPWFFIALLGIPLLGSASGFSAFIALELLYTCRKIRQQILFTLEDQESKRIQKAAKEMRERLKIGNEGKDQGRILAQEAAIAIAAGVKFKTVKAFIERAVPRTVLIYDISNLDNLIAPSKPKSAVIVTGVLKLTWTFRSGKSNDHTNDHTIELWSRQIERDAY